MDDSTKKALTQVVFASLQNSKKKLKIDLVFSDSVFKSGEQIVMPHELAEMILPIARRSLNSKEDYTSVLIEIVTSVQNNGFNVDNVLKEEASTQVPATPCRLALPTFEGCFSDKMNAYIHSTALELGVLPNGIVGTVIAACSAALPGNCRLRIGTKYTEHPTLWVALVGMSSTKKTPSLKTVLGFFEKKQAQFTIENQLNEISYKKSMLRYEVEVANFRKKAIQNKTLMAPDEPKKPIWKDIYLSDATIEAVLHSCSQNPRGIMYFGDEMSGWLGQLSRQNAVKERAQWLEGFNSGRYEQSRIGRGRVALDCFRIVVLVAMSYNAKKL
jgi:hypothetical protein